jgi:hypothetical protein
VGDGGEEEPKAKRIRQLGERKVKDLPDFQGTNCEFGEVRVCLFRFLARVKWVDDW